MTTTTGIDVMAKIARGTAGGYRAAAASAMRRNDKELAAHYTKSAELCEAEAAAIEGGNRDDGSQEA